jgi:uncharacterized protein YabE (DUF348 family)
MTLQAEIIKTTHRLSRLPQQWWSGRPFWVGLGAFALVALLWAGYIFSGKSVTLIINGQAYPARTHQQRVGAALRTLELALQPEDIVQPPLDTHLAAGDTITLQLARPVTIAIDGRLIGLLTQRQRVSEILTDAELKLNYHDEVYLDGVPASLDSLMPSPQPAQTTEAGHLLAAATLAGTFAAGRPQPLQISIQRAAPVTLNDEQAATTFYTARLTVGEALREQGITLFPEDRVTPPLDASLSPGMRIFIERATPVTIKGDGQILTIRTHQETVGAVLAGQGIPLMGQDYTRPPTGQPISTDETIEVVRVKEVIEITQENIAFETKWIPDDAMELDRQEVRQAGQNGIIKRRERVRYENGQEIWREFEDEWLDQSSTDHIIAYGTQIVIRTLETENGPIEYWRRISMLTTAYSAATSGKDPDHPRYGLTRSGLPAGYGIVAVDPKVIPLLTEVYIPNYGRAVAGDTGGGVIGKHIDLGYDDAPPLMYEWRDVYILTPIPPAAEIRYVLPQWPQR